MIHTVCVIHGKPELSIKGFPAELETSKFDLDHGMSMKDMNWLKAEVTHSCHRMCPLSGGVFILLLEDAH